MTIHTGMIKRMARGGLIRGPGTGTSDSIPAEMPTGSHIMPADTTQLLVSNGEAQFTPEDQQALGAMVLEMLRKMTSRTAGAQGGGPFTAMAAGKPMMATGGIVPDDFMQDTRRTMQGAGLEIADQARAGNFAAAAGHTIRGALALPIALANDVVGAPLRTLGGPIANAAYTAATGSNASLVPPAGAPPAPRSSAPAAPGDTSANRQNLQGAAPPAEPSAPTTNGTLVPGADGVYKVQEGGRTLYTNVPGATMPSTGQPSAQSQGAATALSDRYGAEARATAAGPFSTMAANLPAGAGAQIGTVRPFGFRTADQEAPGLPFDTRGLSQREIARLSSQQQANAQSNATSRANTQDQVGVTRDGQQLQAQTAAGQLAMRGRELQQQAPLTAAQAANAGAQATQTGVQTQVSIAALAARDAYGRAVNSGDPKAIAQAQRNLEVIEGRSKPQRHLVVPGGQVTNEFGQNVTQPAMVFDQESGQFVRPPAAAAPGLPQGMSKQVGTSGGKPVYEDAQGKRYIGG